MAIKLLNSGYGSKLFFCITAFITTFALSLILKIYPVLGSGSESSQSEIEGETISTLSFTHIFAILFFVIALSLLHIFSHQILTWMHHKFAHASHQKGHDFQVIASSLGGGIAISYVFLHLLPELNHVHPDLEKINPYITLSGFMLFYGLDNLADKLATPTKSNEWDFVKKKSQLAKYDFNLEIGFLFIYNALIVYTLPEQFRLGRVSVILYMLAMLLHVFSNDHLLEEHYLKPFKSWGCYVLGAAPIVGAIADLLIPSSSLISGILTALLAGFILLNVFKKELPDNAKSSFAWFSAGAIGFGIMLYFAH
ncbi:MAG TPA: hypothetical protein IGS52_01665 [Oscillatoriaceae cyanobacterium M33_DOE_052]|uniref:Zinc/iron permease n=1 Tax=Planktothricoides sp. SpSt-374 TaxID=2282167 RepID=A0A7C3ZX72_9CYAN|nr:hypothetical protein [Oscillatoriaceae cyanobacterium M33_DOE_052]